MSIGKHAPRKKIWAKFRIFFATKRYSHTNCTHSGSAEQIDMGATDACCFLYNMSGKTAAHFNRFTHKEHKMSPIHLFLEFEGEIWM